MNDPVLGRPGCPPRPRRTRQRWKPCRTRIPARSICVRFTCPEFTSLCPVTGQPDFAHLVIDYVPDALHHREQVAETVPRLLPQSRRVSRGLHVADCPPAGRGGGAGWLRIGGYWYPRGGIPIDVFYQTGEPPAGCRLPDPGVAALPRPGMSRQTAAIRDAIRAEALRARLRCGRVRRGASRRGRRAPARRASSPRGHHGDMGWLAEHAPTRRGDPRALWPEARSVVVLGLNYGPEDDPRPVATSPSAARSRSTPAAATTTTRSRRG